jgi:hypothetical protein
MAKFKWHADYFSARESGQCVRREILEAQNACMAEILAKARLGACKRVEVRRAATPAPIRIVHADTERRAKAPMATIIAAALVRAVSTGRSRSLRELFDWGQLSGGISQQSCSPEPRA